MSTDPNDPAHELAELKLHASALASMLEEKIQECDRLRGIVRAAYLHSLDEMRHPLTPRRLSSAEQKQLGHDLAAYGTS